MSSTAKSWLSELDQVIALHGGVAALAESDSSSERAIITLRQHVHDHIEKHSEDSALPTDFSDQIPVDLPNRVPKIFKSIAQRYRISSSTSQASSSRKAALLAKKVEMAMAREARIEAELAEMEHDENSSQCSVGNVAEQLQNRLHMAGLSKTEAEQPSCSHQLPPSPAQPSAPPRVMPGQQIESSTPSVSTVSQSLQKQ